MSKTIILGSVSALACCLGGVCLIGHIDEILRKKKLEHLIEKETIRQLFYDVNELKLHVLHQEKK